MAWYAIAAIIVCAVLILYLAFTFFVGVRCLNLVVKPNRLTGKELRESDEKNGITQCFLDYENLWERHAFTLNSNGAVLSGEYIVNPAGAGRPKKVAVICHGITANRAAAIKYARMFYRIGYQVVLYDARYFGASTGDYCTLGQIEEKDLLNVLAFTKKLFGEDAWIALHGESMGAATVLLALKDTDVGFVVADCPFANSRQLFHEQLIMRFRLSLFPCLICTHFFARAKYHYDFYKVNPMESVECSEVPVCFIHGKVDGFILPRHSEAMYKKCRNKLSELHLVEGADHAYSCVVDPEGYEAVVQAFAKKAEDAYMARAPLAGKP